MNVALYMFHVKIKVFEMIIMWAVMNVIYCKGLDKGESEDEGHWKLHLISSGSWKYMSIQNILVLKFEIPTPHFFSVVNMQFQNRELSKLTLAGPQ